MTNLVHSVGKMIAPFEGFRMIQDLFDPKYFLPVISLVGPIERFALWDELRWAELGLGLLLNQTSAIQ